MTRRVAAFFLLCGICFAAIGGGPGLRYRADLQDHGEYDTAYTKIVNALNDENFELLDATHVDYLAGDARSADGTWMMRAFEDAFEVHFGNQPPAVVEKLFRDWKARDGQSTLRPIAEAFALEQRAWRAKSSGACRVAKSSGAQKAYDRLLERASAVIDEDAGRGKDSPLWYIAAILVAGSRNRPDAQLDALLAEGTKRFPSYEPIYAARLVFLLPEWSGDYDRVDKFIRDAAARTAPQEGRSLYAWLYLELARMGGCEDRFNASKVSWPDLKAAFEDMLVRHPSAWNRNLFATFACRAEDEETTRRLLAELGKDANLGMYSSGISTQSCYRMIQPSAPPVKMREAALGF